MAHVNDTTGKPNGGAQVKPPSPEGGWGPGQGTTSPGLQDRPSQPSGPQGEAAGGNQLVEEPKQSEDTAKRQAKDAYFAKMAMEAEAERAKERPAPEAPKSTIMDEARKAVAAEDREPLAARIERERAQAQAADQVEIEPSQHLVDVKDAEGNVSSAVVDSETGEVASERPKQAARENRQRPESGAKVFFGGPGTGTVTITEEDAAKSARQQAKEEYMEKVAAEAAQSNAAPVSASAPDPAPAQAPMQGQATQRAHRPRDDYYFSSEVPDDYVPLDDSKAIASYSSWRDSRPRRDNDDDKDDRTDADKIRERQETYHSMYKIENEYPNVARPLEEETPGSGEVEDAEDISRFENNRFKAKKAQERTQDVYAEARINIASQHIDKKTNEITYSKRVNDVIGIACRRWNVSKENLFRGVMLRISLGVDVDGTIMKDDPFDFHLTDEQFVQAVTMMMESERVNGHPWGMVTSGELVIGGSRRFPLGVIPKKLARAYTTSGGSLHGYKPSELVDMVRKSWLNETQPAIMMNTTGDKISQRYAIENMVRAIAGLDEKGGKDSSWWNVSPTIDRCVDEIMEHNLQETYANTDLSDVYENQKNEIVKATRRAAKRFRREKITGSAEKGNLSYYYDDRHFSVSDGFMLWANFMRTAGVVANIPIMASGAMEHFVGNINSIGAQWLLAKTTGKDYKVTDYLKEEFTSQDGKEAIAVLKALVSVGDMDIVTMFCNEIANGNEHMTKMDANRFLNEWVRGNPDPGLVQRFNEKLESITNALMPGDIGFRTADAKRFLENLMVEMSWEADRGNPSITSEQLEEAVRSGGVGKAIAMTMKYAPGKDSLVSMRNMTMGRMSPLTYATDLIMRKNGITNWLITVGLDTYVTYGLNLIQLMVPFSNTFSYLAVRGITSEKAGGEGDAANVRNYQLGGHDSFGRGFLKCFIYDAVKLANIAAIALFGAVIIGLLGFEDPDDPDDLKHWDEYVIGGEKIRLAWWMNDLVGWGWPAAVAINVFLKHPEQPNLALDVFWDGVYDMTSGASILDACTLFTNARDNMETMAQMVANPEYVPENRDWKANVVLEAEHFFANVLGKSTPGVFKSFYRDTLFVGQDARDRTAYYVYDRDSDNPDAVKWVDDESEAMRRVWAKSNPLFALMENAFRNHGDPSKTGYLFWEMPIATMKDQRRSSFLDRWDFDLMDPESVPADPKERQMFLEEHATRMIHELEEYGTPELFLTQGGAIPYNARKNAIEYCYGQIAKAKLDYVERTAAGEYPTYDASYAASTRMGETCSYYYDLLEKWFKNEDIPWSNVAYEKLISDNQVYYTWKDSGEEASAWDALWFGDAVEKRYEPYGNHPTSFLPFTTVDRRDRGFNAETIPDWYVDGLTDVKSVFDESKNTTITRGRDQGRNLASVLFGGVEPVKNQVEGYMIDTESGQPTIGHRSYVPREGALPDSLKDITLESVAGGLGIDVENLDQAIKDIKSTGSKSKGGTRNFNSWRRYSGGGGSSYAPRIYSNPRSVSSDKAASMYVKQPYGATSDYLRPAFYTKGSREAYRRQDM